MSWQAQTAVRKYGQIRDVNLLYFALYLAEHANEAGHIDPAPNQETMATEFRVSARTVRSWLAKLVSLEVVEQTRIGSGPGRGSAYTFLLPMPEKVEMVEAKAEKGEAPQLPPFTPKMEAKPASISTFTPSESAKVEALQAHIFHLEQQMAEMMQKMATLLQKVEAFNGFVSTFQTEKVEGKVEKGGSPTGENEPSINSLKDLKELKEGGAFPPPSLPPLTKVETAGEQTKVGRLEEFFDDPKEKTRARLIQELCDFWCKSVKKTKPLLNGSPAKNQTMHEHYYTPAGELLECVGFDLQRAKDLVTTKRQDMNSAGFTPTKLSVVVRQVLDDLERIQTKPAPAKKTKPVYQDADAEFYSSF